MNRSRSPSRRGPGRPKRSTRKENPSSTDNEAHESVNRSPRESKRMRLVSPSTPSTSRASSAQPRRHKNLTATRRAVMTFFIESAQESPKKNGKVGSLQWMGKVLKEVNKAAKGVTDRVTNLDVIWWLEKHFSDKVKDFTGPIQPTWSTTRERSSSLEFEEQENGRSGSRAESSDEASTDVEESQAANSRVVRKRKAKASSRASPCTLTTSRASQRGKSSAQPRRHKNLTATRRAVMIFFIESAQESPKKNGKVGSLQWMGEVIKVVNKAAKGATDCVTNLDVIWWLEKHFDDKIKDFTGPIRPPWSQSRERSSSSELEEQENDRSGFRAESSNEASTDSEESEVENNGVERKKKAKEATPQRAAENFSKNVEPAEGGAENVPPDAVGNVREEVVIVPEAVIALDKVANTLKVAADSQAEEEEAPELAAISQGVSSSSSVKLTVANVEAPAANVRPAASADEATAAPSPQVQVLDPDNESHEGRRKESGHDTLPAGSGTDADGEPIFRALEVIPPENPSEGVCLEGSEPVAGGQKAAVNPLVQRLEIQMEIINLQINELQKDKRYSEQIEVLTAQSKAMTAMISLLYKI